MARKLRPGDRVNEYEITELLNSGAMACSYLATSCKEVEGAVAKNELVFLKQFKSPSISVPWYRDYVAYQEEIKRRIQAGRATNFAYRFVEFFEADAGSRTYFQVFEFLTGGQGLKKILEQIRTRRTSVSWEQRLILAMVMMAGIDAIHEARIVHCDLNPDSIQLFQDSSIASGYRLKIIDMDWSILEDKRAPWHGQQGYVGTPGYFSPEHVRGEIPCRASDVFTCGLMLYELLAEGHPYHFDDEAAYAKAVLSHKASPPRLADKMPPPAKDEEVAAVIHRCLSPSPSDRPTAKEVNLALRAIRDCHRI